MRALLLLVIDIGNTNTGIGVFREGEMLYSWRLATDPEATGDQLALQLLSLFSHHGLERREVGGIAVSCVVPPLGPPVEEMGKAYFGRPPLFVTHRTPAGITVKYDNPAEVGPDRIVNAAAAFHRHGGPVVVVDFGTATTVDAVSAAGEYLGGAIAPGVGISVSALFREAAMLPRVELARPAAAIGRNTVASMQAGFVFGFAGQVDGLVRRVQKDLGGGHVVATGGLAHLIAPECETVDEVDRLLTLTGLQLIFARNQTPGAQNRNPDGSLRPR